MKKRKLLRQGPVKGGVNAPPAMKVMNPAFMEIMRQLRNAVEEYPNGEMRIDNEDFVNLVNLAEEAEQLRTENERLISWIKAEV